jgi:hypothetical protein
MSNQKTSTTVARARRRDARSSVPEHTAAGGAHTVVDLHRQLLEVAFDLTTEHVALPPGSVLRCFARAVHLARLDGATGLELPERARRIAASMLRQRLVEGRHATELAATA